MKRIPTLVLVLTLICTLFWGCAQKNILHCDRCGKEVKAEAQMDEDWTISCAQCEKEVFGEDGLVP